jgi:ABC-type phosphate/phosphonate transport system substrate-binding protein
MTTDAFSFTRRHLLTALAAPALAAGGLPARAQGGEPALRFLLTPYLPPAALMRGWERLRAHLAGQLGREVATRSGRDFRHVAESVRDGEADIALLPAHLARLATLDWGCEALALTFGAVQVQLLVRPDGPVRRIADLAGRADAPRPRVGVLDPLSFSAAVGQSWLAERGLRSGGDYEVVNLLSVPSALHALSRDEVLVVVLADTQLRNLPPQTPTGFRPLVQVGDMPGPVLVARRALGEPLLARLRTAVAAFEPDAAQQPAAYNTRLVAPPAALLKSLDGAAARAREVLRSPA